MRYVVLGGGIAGVCCAQELVRCVQEQRDAHSPSAALFGAQEAPHASQVVLVSGSSVMKGVREVARLGRMVEELQVVESPLAELAAGSGGVLTVVQAAVAGVDLQRKVLQLSGDDMLPFDKLCICTGARPKELAVPGADHPAVMTLRDTDSVQELTRRLRSCRRLVLVGNGGIALELAGTLLGPVGGAEDNQGRGGCEAAAAATTAAEPQADLSVPGAGGGGSGSSGDGRELVWVLKHGHIGDAFFDLDAAAFLLQRVGAAANAAADAGGDGAGVAGGFRTGGGTGRTLAEPGDVATASDASVSGDQMDGEAGAGRGPGSMAAAREELAAAAGGVGVGEPARPMVQAVGHAAGPAWTRELLRELQQAHAPDEKPPPSFSAPVSLCGVADEAASDGRSGGGDGSGGSSGGHGGGAFSVKLEFSATVSRIDDGPASQGGEGAGGAGGGLATHASKRANTAASMDGGGGRGGGGGGAEWPAYVTLSNGQVYGTDLVVVAIGVEPYTSWLPPQLERAPDGGLVVRCDMQTSVPDVYAAGDCCSTAPWYSGGGGRGGESGVGGQRNGSEEREDDEESFAGPHWFQMRLWTQARVMGTYAARCMAGLADELASGFNFELFTHVTRFLGCKVVLLGLYNGQRLEAESAEDVRLYSRAAPAANGKGETFVRVLLLRGRMQGAVLIGETEMEEAFENLILDRLDLTSYGPHILDPEFELEHVFD